MRIKYLIVWLILALGAGPVWPATFLVDSPADSHDIAPGDGLASDHTNPDSARCTLRAALEEANAWPGPDTVLVPTGMGAIYLRLGVIRVLDNGTVLTGVSGRPVIDGVTNTINHATLVLESDSNLVAALHFRRARGDAITVTGSYNTLGDSTAEKRLLLTDNGLDNQNAAAVRIIGAGATHNRIIGNYIGLDEDGLTVAGNRHGVTIEHGASYNQIGAAHSGDRNFISGNDGYGVIISATSHSNQITRNFIGPDSTGDNGPGNQLGGILLMDNAHDNLIGAENLTFGNLVSGNQGIGIELNGPGVTENIVNGNLIGTNWSGQYELSNVGDGLRLTQGAHDNLIGGPHAYSGNLLSGNGGNGICLRGENVTGNLLTANWVGPTLSGYGALGNGWIDGDGILLDSGAHHNTIGGMTEAERNVASGNYRFGLHINGTGTNNNAVMGNFFGVNGTGTSSLGNAVGVAIRGGAQNNTIGGLNDSFRNIISGNRSDGFPYGAGVLIEGEGTNFNAISANIIGLDVTGHNPRRNGTAGVIIGGGAQYNLIGGDHLSDGNIISGNGLDDPIDGRAAGIHIYGSTTAFNRVVANVIGLGIDGHEIVGNRGHGVGIYSGSNNNQIGGETYYRINQIVGSEGAGVFIAGSQTQSNLIRNNIIYENAGLGIDLRDSAQASIYPPTIVTVGRLTSPGPRYVTGRDAPPGSRIDFYSASSPPDPSGAGEAANYLGYGFANANGFFATYLPTGPAGPLVLTAIAVDSADNSSEFSINAYSPDATSVDDELTELPRSFSLDQNYPNPFNAGTVISFSIPRAADTRLIIFNSLGQEVCRLVNRRFSAGEYRVLWDGKNSQGLPVASGAYFYRLDLGYQTAVRKMLLLK
jgi:hypothetical protein